MSEEPSPFLPDGAMPPTRPRIDLSRFDRLPPHSLEAEQGILGCCLIEAQSIDLAVETGCNAGWFYDLRHRTLWEVLTLMRSERLPIDLISLGQRLKDFGVLDGLGGLAYLSELNDAVPSVANLTHYLGIAGEKAVRRNLLIVANEAAEAARNETIPTETVVAEAERAILSVRTGFGGEDSTTMKSMLTKALDALQERIQNGDKKRITTGFRSIDRYCKGGWRPGNLVVIAARPSMGKSSIALTMARLIAGKGVPVGFVSLEMNEEEVTGTLTAQECRVDWDQFDDTNKPDETQSRAMVAGAGRMKNLPIHFDYGKKKGTTVMMTPAAISARARRWVGMLGVRIVFVDYLQRIEAPNKRNPREVQVAEISKAMKDLAQELEVPVVVLAQLNRDMEKDKARKPRMSDLRESGAIEQDADFIGMLYAPTEDDLDMGNDPSIPIDVNMYLAKNRKGTRWVDVPFKFNRSITLFEEPTVRPF